MWYEYQLPIVPSTNSLYRNVSRVGRVKTSKYKKWIELAAMSVRPIPESPIEKCKIRISLPFLATSDMDNRVKGVMDLLKTMRVIVDDNMKHVVGLKVEIDYEMVSALMNVYVTVKE